LGVQDAFFEGKKAEETAPRKSTPRTLKEVGQQYPPVSCTMPSAFLCPAKRVEKLMIKFYVRLPLA
jgi:hypothetical protein